MTHKLISVMSLAKNSGNRQCLKRLISLGREQRMVHFILIWKTNQKWHLQEVEVQVWMWFPKDQEASISLIQMDMSHRCRNNTLKLIHYTVEINSTLGCPIMNTRHQKHNSHLNHWVFPLKRWIPPELFLMSTIRAQFLNSNKVQIQREISEIQFKRWTPEN